MSASTRAIAVVALAEAHRDIQAATTALGHEDEATAMDLAHNAVTLTLQALRILNPTGSLI